MTATPSFKYVFVTSSAYTVAQIGSLANADALCQTAATNAGLPGTYRCWLSDNATSASSRLTHAAVPYKLVNGTTVANNWTDLTDGALASAISLDQNGATYTGEVWTGTNTDGSSSGSTCNSWTDATNVSTTTVGMAGNTDGTWTNIYLQFCNDNRQHLYAIQQ